MGKKGGHHGGAWKVAYADFVTAMMALFMVLWISAQDQEILLSTSQYFQNPFNAPLDRTMGVMTGAGAGGGASGQGDESPSSVLDLALLNQMANEFYRLLDIEESDDDAPVEVKVTSDGLRIVVYNRNKRPIFEPYSSNFTPWGELVVQNMAWLIERQPMQVRIDAHTAAPPASVGRDDSLWALSVEQANSVRQALVRYALPAERVDSVTGFADSRPLSDLDPEDDGNQRVEISLVVR